MTDKIKRFHLEIPFNSIMNGDHVFSLANEFDADHTDRSPGKREDTKKASSDEARI
jgi:hypothetical protein